MGSQAKADEFCANGAGGSDKKPGATETWTQAKADAFCAKIKSGATCDPNTKMCRAPAGSGGSGNQNQGSASSGEKPSGPPPCTEARCNALDQTCDSKTKKCVKPTGPPSCEKQFNMNSDHADTFCKHAFQEFATCDATTKKCKEGTSPTLNKKVEKSAKDKKDELKAAKDAVEKKQQEEVKQMEEFTKKMKECENSNDKTACKAEKLIEAADPGELARLKEEAAVKEVTAAVTACFNDGKDKTECEEKGKKAFQDLGLDQAE